MAAALVLALAGAQALAQSAPGAQATAPGTVVRNVGYVEYSLGVEARTAPSNEATLLVEPPPSPSTIALQRLARTGPAASLVAPTQCRSDAGFVALPSPYVQGEGTLDEARPLPLANAQIVHGGDAVFVRLVDLDQNRDASAVESIEVRLVARGTGDAETLRLFETGPATGEFAGHVPSSMRAGANGDCTLQVRLDSEIEALYVDPQDARDSARAAALVDPYGRIFDSRTGEPIDGARVRLIDGASGLPARVLGDDGVSIYPSELITGQPVTDAGGTTYSLPPGVFRFPLVASGDYRLEVIPPRGHAFPSSLGIEALQQLPGAPYRLGEGSYGRAFAVAGGPSVALDLPVDPAGTALFLRKSANVEVASPGDLVQYTLMVENSGGSGEFRSVRLLDRLPPGVRYRRGSARLGDVPVADPTISPDGLGLEFELGALAPNARATLRYVVEVTLAARGRELVNLARAIGSGDVASNEARASLRLRRDLFTERGFLAGRVIEGSCEGAGPTAGVAGVRVYLEDGRYAVTDEEGKYHFEDLAPGSHVVQLDTTTLPAYLEVHPCSSDSPRSAGRAYSQFVELRAGALWRADFFVKERPAPTGELALQLRSRLVSSALVEHEVELSAGGLPASDIRLLVNMPAGLAYAEGSATAEGAPLPASVVDGTLVLSLRDLPAGSVRRVSFRTSVTVDAAGELPVRAVALFDSPAQPRMKTEPAETRMRRGEARYAASGYSFTPRYDVLEASLEPADRAALERIVREWRGARDLRVRVVGHADATPIARRHRAKFADNYVLSRARAQVAAEYLIEALNLPLDRIVIEGRGADEPLAPGRDAASLARNRRVEITIEGARLEADAPLETVAADSGARRIATLGTHRRDSAARSPGVPPDPTASPADRRRSPERRATPSASFDIETIEPGIGWVIPEENATPPIASIKIAVRHAPTDVVELSVNGAPVSTLNFDGVTTNAAKTIGVSRWRGVDLESGENVLTARVRDASGRELERLERRVHYGGGAVRATFAREGSVLAADGRARPVIALRLFDASGKPARPGTIGTFRVDPPYRSWWEVESLDDNPLLAVGPREPTFEVGADGMARLELEPTTRSGHVTLHLRFDERRSQDLRVWLEPAAREWVLVGIASGTAAHRTISQNMQAAARADGVEEGLEEEGRLAFFAKGSIKGEYLLTAAYDSARDREEARERLQGVIEPDRYYLLYGDATEQREEAASARKLYLKLERRQWSALFGDYDTGFTLTELARYSRTLNGFRTDFAGEALEATAFAARSDQGFARDELRGDGTSGLYRLGRAPVIIGSDKIRIEVRDRFRTERIVETRTLARFLDYSIDYEAGTLFFKQPVPSRDADFNPVFIIVDYETLQGGREETTAGARTQLELGDERGQLGASLLHEGAAAGDTRLAGLDFEWQLSDAARARAELARSSSDDPARAEQAVAYLAELEFVDERLDGRAYLREQETGFGLGQQLATESGTRKAGIDGRWRLGGDWQLAGEGFVQEQLESGAERRLVSAELRHQAALHSAGVGARHVEEEEPGGVERISDQAFVTGSIDVLDRRVTLRGSSELALGGREESIDFPTRTLLGADYHLRQDVTLFAEYEHAEGERLESDMTRVGVRARPWERTQLSSSVAQELTEYGPRAFANFGLTQGFRLDDRWSLDFGVDQSNTIRSPGLAPFDADVPLASGTLTEDFFAAFAGAQYQAEDWTWTSRAERRNADSEDRWGLTSGLYREPSRGHAFSLAFQGFDGESLQGESSLALDLALAWAYRPVESRWIVLNRLDLKHDDREGGTGRSRAARIVENFHANLQLDPRTQLGLQLGARFVDASFDGAQLDGFSGLVGLDARRDLTRRFDLGLHGALLASPDAEVARHSIGLDVGVTLARNVWVALGYNFAGFRDGDFAASRYTARGPYLKFLVKADQDTFKDLRLDSLRPPR